MGVKYSITIEVEGGNHVVKLTDSAGNEKTGDSAIVILGGNEIFSFGWGHPITLAKALGEALTLAQGDEWWASFIEHHAKDMAMRCTPIPKTNPDELLERWGEEDIEKAKKETVN